MTNNRYNYEISNNGFSRISSAVVSKGKPKTKFTHEELMNTGKISGEFTDLGSYELTRDSSGTPEGGNFIGGIIFGNKDVGVLEIDPHGVPDDLELNNGEVVIGEQIEELYADLIHVTGVESLISQGHSKEEAESMMGKDFWGLGGLVMKNREMIYDEDE